ncbi:MAG TPA: LPS assembly protein LptD [Candidatus Omnitrophota bacterium]|nr:LPS assembly protein LptD [Candidatus Omnitrophota bacterium]
MIANPILKSKRHYFFIYAILSLLIYFPAADVSSADSTSKANSVELNGDVVEYSVDSSAVTARGNVIIHNAEATLYCDEVQFDQATNIAHALGHVRLVNKQGEISGDELTFDFNTMTGDFHNARIVADPYYGGARKISRVSDSKMVMEDGYLTTSDFDKPEYRVVSSRIEIYPGEKIVASHNRIKLGNIPVAYMPHYVQSLKEKEPRWHITPGHDKDWGAFLLTTWRYYVSEKLKGAIHLDYRDRLDFAGGLDVDYKTENFGTGVLKTYYTMERDITSDRILEERPSVMSERDRYKAEWRHRWQMDEKTNVILQYYRISDATFLKDYFERDFDRDQTPPSFFVLTRTLPKGILSLRADKQVNSFVATTERIPELRYDLTNQKIGNTSLYYKNFTTMTSLSYVGASPTDVRLDTNRIHTEHQLSHPMKLGFLEFTPFIGGEWTFYSRLKDPNEDKDVREYYKAGASLQTKFYRLFDVNAPFLGEEIKRMRHIITPSLTYQVAKDPTIANSELEQFDTIDSRLRQDAVTVALENKLQVKRNGQTVEFLRAVLSSDYYLEDDPSGEGFEIIKTDIDFRPADWLTLYFDSQYDLDQSRLDTANFDFYINSGQKWNVGVGRRYNVDVDDQITTHFHYKFNSKWAFQLLNRFNIDTADLEEQQYVLTRDLHSWEMDIHINDKKEEGSEFIVVFRLKAFPDIGFDFGTEFNRRESGSSSGE